MYGMELGMHCLQLQIQTQLSPYQCALELHETSKKTEVVVLLGDKSLVVPAAFITQQQMMDIFEGEKYAGTIGGMFFVSRGTPKHYWHFAAIHELAEHAAPRGFDVTGLAAHYQALAVELGYAKCILSPKEYAEYLVWRKKIERSNFFQMEFAELVDRIAQRMEEIFQSLPKYITYRRKKLIGLSKTDI